MYIGEMLCFVIAYALNILMNVFYHLAVEPRCGRGERRVPHTLFFTSIFLKVNTHHSNYMYDRKKISILFTSISVH